jgi:hypothetical protein
MLAGIKHALTYLASLGEASKVNELATFKGGVSPAHP